MGILFGRYSKQLFRFIFRMTADAEESEDLVQNVFYRMLKYRHTYKGEGEFTTWMYHLTRNVLADYYKKSKRCKYRREVKGYDMVMGVEKPVEEKLGKEQEDQLLHMALDKLRIEEKEVLVLSKFQGLKYEEIGQILNCSEGAVKVRVHRAIHELKKIYTQLNKIMQ